MIRFKHYLTHINTIVKGLAPDVGPRSWNVVVPPVFWADQFAMDVFRAVKADNQENMVARISADGLNVPLDLIRQIQLQWLPGHAPTMNSDNDPVILLTRLLDGAGAEHKKIIVITEFHKMLGKLDERILVAMRDAEHAGRMHSVIVSIYPHEWIKKQWKNEGYLLHVSNYGDTHIELSAEILSLREITDDLRNRHLPEDLIRRAYEWTGGYPEPTDAFIEKWENLGRPELRPEVMVTLNEAATKKVEPLAKKLDPEGDDRCRKYISHLYRRIEEQESVFAIKSYHPWKQILLDEAGLRADCLGDAVLKAEIEQGLGTDGPNAVLYKLSQMARIYYDQGQYDLAAELIERVDAKDASSALQLLHMHSRIMMTLRGGMQVSRPDLDCDWRALGLCVREAEKKLPGFVADIKVRRLLLARYQDLIKTANIISSAAKGGNCRVVDCLAGLRPGELEDRPTAFTLLVLQYEAGSHIRGDSAACKAILEMPEQLLRTWAFWKMNVNFYNAPAENQVLSEYIRRNWGEDSTEVHIPEEGMPFESMRVFAHYLYAMQQLGLCTGVVTWEDQVSRDRDLAIFELRNDASHAVALLNGAMRRRLFSFVDLWLSKIESECSGINLSRPRALEQFEPLPVM